MSCTLCSLLTRVICSDRYKHTYVHNLIYISFYHSIHPYSGIPLLVHSADLFVFARLLKAYLTRVCFVLVVVGRFDLLARTTKNLDVVWNIYQNYYVYACLT